jgi:hypothetical protein
VTHTGPQQQNQQQQQQQQQRILGLNLDIAQTGRQRLRMAVGAVLSTGLRP